MSDEHLMNRILAAAVGSVTTAVSLSTVWYAHQKLAAQPTSSFLFVALVVLAPMVPMYVYVWRKWHDTGASA